MAKNIDWIWDDADNAYDDISGGDFTDALALCETLPGNMDTMKSIVTSQVLASIFGPGTPSDPKLFNDFKKLVNDFVAFMGFNTGNAQALFDQVNNDITNMIEDCQGRDSLKSSLMQLQKALAPVGQDIANGDFGADFWKAVNAAFSILVNDIGSQIYNEFKLV